MQRQPIMPSEWEGMNISTPVRRMVLSSTEFSSLKYIPMIQCNQKSSNSIAVSLIRKPVVFGFHLLDGVEHIVLLDKLGLVEMQRKMDNYMKAIR
ncbi:unnamed protein product [Caenorhabditis brenneri]